MADTSPIRRRTFLRTLRYAASAAVVLGARGRVPAQEPAPRLRRVWLRLLLDQVAERVRAGQRPTEEERYLAGLTGVRYLYVDAEQGDVILEGPADRAWRVRAADGMVLGAESRRPLLQLDDLAVAYRNARDSSPPPSVSLEPRPESQQRVQEALRAAGHPATERARDKLADDLREAWGPQDVATGGVPVRTRFNRVMADADWEMKRISLGESDPGVEGIVPYADREFDAWRRRVVASGAAMRHPAAGSRFWFYPAYAEFERSETGDAVAIPGDAVQLLTESHFRTIAEPRQVMPEPTPAAREFARAFTENYAAVADAQPLYADLRNLFDWVAVVRLLRLLDAARRTGWDFAFLERGYPVADVPVERTKPGLITLKHGTAKTPRGQYDLVFPAWGGVAIDVDQAVRPERLRVSLPLGSLAARARAARPTRAGAWWA